MLNRLADSKLVRKAYFVCRRIPVLGDLLHSRVTSVLPQGKRIWTTVARGPGKGLWMFVDPRFDHEFSNGKHEAWIQDLLRNNLREGDCFYDVGAHIGFFSLIAARIVGPAGHVYSFEPDPQNVSVMTANRERNEMPQIDITKAAVWESSQELTFERSNVASSGMEGRVIQEQDSAGDSRIGRFTDDFFSNRRAQPPNLIKIDVEGAEYAVLAGARKLLSEFKPRVLCEVHGREMVRPLEEFLAAVGYAFIRTPAEAKSYLWAEPA